MHILDNTYFTGTLTMDTDCEVVNLWLEDNEQRIFRQHFNKDLPTKSTSRHRPQISQTS